MSEKWNGLMIAGDKAPETATTIVDAARNHDATAEQITTPEGNTFLWIEGYTLPGTNTRTRFWLLNQIKKRPRGVEWAVATHANNTEDTGRAY